MSVSFYPEPKRRPLILSRQAERRAAELRAREPILTPAEKRAKEVASFWQRVIPDEVLEARKQAAREAQAKALAEKLEKESSVRTLNGISIDTGVKPSELPEITLPKEPRLRRASAADHALKLATCGHWTTGWNLKTGLQVNFKYECDCRDCPSCGEKFGRNYRAQIWWALRNRSSDILAVTGTAAQISHLRGLATKQSFLQFPHSDSRVVLIIDSSVVNAEEAQALAAVSLTEKSLDDYDWAEWQNLPPGRNRSGLLGYRKPEVPERENQAVVKMQVTHTDRQDEAAKILAKDAALQALGETYELLPKDEAGLQFALGVRQAHYEEALRKRGLAFTTTSTILKESLLRLRWEDGVKESFYLLVKYGMVEQTTLEAWLAANWREEVLPEFDLDALLAQKV